MSKPLVSVVMVTCNVDRFLGEAVESILVQTFNDFEFIIVDYGSTDTSKSIIAHYAETDPRVRLHEIPHCGLGEARNAACLLAQGRYIALMDADDVALPQRLQLEVDFMEKHPTVGLLGAAVQWINASGEVLYISRHPADDAQLRKALAAYCAFWQPTVFLLKEAFVCAGGYRNAFAPAEDYDLWLRVTEHFQCSNLEDIVLKIPDSSTSGFSAEAETTDPRHPCGAKVGRNETRGRERYLQLHRRDYARSAHKSRGNRVDAGASAYIRCSALDTTYENGRRNVCGSG